MSSGMTDILKRLVPDRIKEHIMAIFWMPRNVVFLLRFRHLSRQKKIILALTPHTRMDNLGDHAQAVAIHRWLSRYFPEYLVMELDKEESRYLLPAIERVVSDEDLILLQSGGNLGERGKLTEPIRRLWISRFLNNRIVSLPQTIYFSGTPRGNIEKEHTSRIYSEHSRLTIIARDRISLRLAEEMFPGATNSLAPDFCLFLDSRQDFQPRTKIKRFLVCLRNDPESLRTEQDREWLAANLPGEVTFFNTMLNRRIKRGERVEILGETLGLFKRHDAIITDRLHGMIFGYLSRRPVVAFPTADHKISSGVEWFDDVNFIRLAERVEDVPAALSAANSRASIVPDWVSMYFAKLADQIEF